MNNNQFNASGNGHGSNHNGNNQFQQQQQMQMMMQPMYAMDPSQGAQFAVYPAA
jgi:hypothetical protein